MFALIQFVEGRQSDAVGGFYADDRDGSDCRLWREVSADRDNTG